MNSWAGLRRYHPEDQFPGQLAIPLSLREQMRLEGRAVVSEVTGVSGD